MTQSYDLFLHILIHDRFTRLTDKADISEILIQMIDHLSTDAREDIALQLMIMNGTSGADATRFIKKHCKNTNLKLEELEQAKTYGV